MIIIKDGLPLILCLWYYLTIKSNPLLQDSPQPCPHSDARLYLTLNPRPNRNRHHLCYNIPSVNKDCLTLVLRQDHTRLEPGTPCPDVPHQPDISQSWSNTSFYLLDPHACTNITNPPAYSCFGPEISPSATFEITNLVGYG